MLTIAAPGRRRCGAAARQQFTVESRLISTMRRVSSSDVVVGELRSKGVNAPPALLTRMSMGRPLPDDPSEGGVGCPASVRSTSTASASTPKARISSATELACSCSFHLLTTARSMSKMATSAPRRANRRAWDRPIPPAPPVTIARLPDSRALTALTHPAKKSVRVSLSPRNARRSSPFRVPERRSRVLPGDDRVSASGTSRRGRASTGSRCCHERPSQAFLR